MRELLQHLERSGGELGPPLAYLAGQGLAIDEDELRGAVRRAELLLASGGDPRRELELEGRAVGSLSGDLDTTERRDELARGLERLHDETEGLPAVEAALTRLGQEPDLAWRCYACALLAGALAGEG